MTTTTASNERTIPVALIDTVRVLVAKLNKRAAKIGVEPFVLTVGEARVVERHRDIAFDGMGIGTYQIEVADIAITGAPIKVAGHELVGRVDFEEGLTIVNTRPGGAMPTSYREATQFCQHCNSMRKRKSVFVFLRESGEHIQVGRTCLTDYLGHSADHALWAVREWNGIFADIDEECERSGGRAAPVVAPVLVLAAAARSIREHGFTSRKHAEERETVPTSSDVHDILFDPKMRAKRGPDADDFAKAETVLAWVKDTMGAKADKSDFEFNAVQLCAAPHVAVRRVGLLTSLIACYDRAMEAAIEREAIVNAYVGEVGKRLDFEAVYRGENWFETSFGSMCIARFQTPAGLLVYKGASPFWPDNIQAGQPVKFKATIKEHADYKGTKQTIVARAKLAVAA